MLPKRNEKHVLDDLGEDLRRGIRVHYVSMIDEALDLALLPAPPAAPRAEDPAGAGPARGAVR